MTLQHRTTGWLEHYRDDLLNDLRETMALIADPELDARDRQAEEGVKDEICFTLTTVLAELERRKAAAAAAAEPWPDSELPF